MFCQLFKGSQECIELFNFSFAVLIINSFSGKLADNLLSVFIAQNHIDRFEADRSCGSFTILQESE